MGPYFVLRQEFGVDLNLTFGYKDTSKQFDLDTPRSLKYKKIRYFQAQQQGGSRSDGAISTAGIIHLDMYYRNM